MTRRPARAYHHGDLRRELLASARQLLEEGGPAALTLREAARRVGVAAPSAYHYFANLEGMAAVLAEEGFVDLAAALEAAPTDTQGRLAPAGNAYLAWARGNTGLYRLMFGESHAGVGASGAVRIQRARVHALLVSGLHRRLPEGDVPVAALFSWSLVHGLAMLLIDGQAGPGAAAMVPDVFRLAARGLPLGPVADAAEGG